MGGTEQRRPRGRGRTVYDTPAGPLEYSDSADSLWLEYGGKGWLSVDLASGRAWIDAAGSTAEDVWLLSHPLLSLALLELLKRRGRYPVHAAAMETGGGVVLLAGPSGAGKTTLAMALLEQGWGFLGDDTVFLASGATGGPTVLGFADEIDASPATLAMFGGAKALAGTPAAPGVGAHGKVALLAEEVFPRVTVVTHGESAAVVFLAVAHQLDSVLTPLHAGEALVELAPNVLLTERTSSQAHFGALGALATGVACWRLATGRDFPRLAAMLGNLVGDRGTRRP